VTRRFEDTGPPVNDCAPGSDPGGGTQSNNRVAEALFPETSAVNAHIRRLTAEYRRISAVQAPIELAFWSLEQRKGQLADRLANEGVKPFCRDE
jgi:hypothetical protein